MTNHLKITINAEGLSKALQNEPLNIIQALQKAHSKVASQADKMLKKGLSWRAGRDTSDPAYKSSPKGSLPYMHTGRLRNSIGHKIIVRGNKVSSEVGSGAMGFGVEYAKYLQGYNNDGIRPFLDYIEGVYNAITIKEEFFNYFTPLGARK